LANCLFLLNSGGSILLNDAASFLQMNETGCTPGTDNCSFLLNAGGNILLNDGTSILQMNRANCSGSGPTPSAGGTGGSNTRVRKRVGKQLVSDNLGNRPTVLSNGVSKSEMLIKSKALSRAKLFTKTHNESNATLIPTTGGASVSKRMYPTKNETKAPLIYIEKAESWGIPHPSVLGLRKPKKESKAKKYMEMLESIDKVFTTFSSKKNEELDDNQFTFMEPHLQWLNEATQSKLVKLWKELKIPQRAKLLTELKINKSDVQTLAGLEFTELPLPIRTTLTTMKDNYLIGFLRGFLPLAVMGVALGIMTSPVGLPIKKIKELPVDMGKLQGPKAIPVRKFNTDNFKFVSAFIGLVTFTPDGETMTITMTNTGTTYNYCGVPPRIFDNFRDSPSKGKYYNRAIKGQFDC